MVVVGVGEGVAGGVPRGLGSWLLQRGWARVPVELLRPVGGRTGGPLGSSWPSWPGGCCGQVIAPVPVVTRGLDGPGMHLSEACLEAPDVGRLVRGDHLCGGGFAAGSQVGVQEGRQALWGPQLGVRGRVYKVEECPGCVGCSFLTAESDV